MKAGRPVWPVGDAIAARDMRVAPARSADPRTLLHLLAALNDSFIKDGVEDYLDRILGWDAAPLRPEEITKIVPPLQGCLWPLVTEALQRAKGHPDRDLVRRIGFASQLDAEGTVDGGARDTAYARRLAALVSDLLDEVSDDDDSELPDFGATAAEDRWSA